MHQHEIAVPDLTPVTLPLFAVYFQPLKCGNISIDDSCQTFLLPSIGAEIRGKLIDTIHGFPHRHSGGILLCIVAVLGDTLTLFTLGVA